MSGDQAGKLQQAREIIASLSEREKTLLREELEELIAEDTTTESSGAWDYQRQPWGRGWIQRERKVRYRKDGSRKIYVYWSFHYIEDGRRKSEHIGSDEKLAQWKESNPGTGQEDG